MVELSRRIVLTVEAAACPPFGGLGSRNRPRGGQL